MTDHPPAASLPEALVRFRDLFNAGSFWESHEALETPWRTNRSAFYKGLILYASAFVHLQRGNAYGVRAQLEKATKTLEPFQPHYLGVDVAELMTHIGHCLAVVPMTEEGSPDWQRRATPPHLDLQPRLVRGAEPELTSG